MSDVRIRMDADLGGTQAALRRVQEDVRKLTDRMRELGTAGKGIDLSAGAEDAARHLETVRRQYRELLELNSDLRRRITMSGQQGADPWDVDPSRLGYLNRRTQAEAHRRMLEHALRGTPWQPPAGGGGGRSGGSSASGDEGGVGGMLGGLMGGLKLGGALLGVTGTAQVVMQSYRAARALGQTADQFMRQVKPTGEEFLALRDRLAGVGKDLGVAGEDAARLGAAYLKAAGGTADSAIAGATNAAGFGRGFGIDPNASAESFGRIEFLTGGKGGMGQKELAILIGETIAKSGMWAKSEAVLETFKNHVEQVSARTLQAPGDLGEFAALRASMYSNTQYPGLKSSGENLLGAMQSAIANPGGGIGGEFMMNQLMQRATGLSDPFSLLYARQSMSLTDRTRSGRTLAEEMVSAAERQFGPAGDDGVDVMAGSVFHMTGPQFRAIKSAIAGMGGGGFGDAAQRLQDQGIDLKTMRPDAIADALKTVGASGPELGAMARQYLGRQDVAESGTGQGLREALGSGDTERLRAALLKTEAEFGRIPTEFSRLEQIETDIRDVLREQVGQRLADNLPGILEGVKSLVTHFVGELGTHTMGETPGEIVSRVMPGALETPQSFTPPAGGPANIGPASTMPGSNRSVWDSVRNWWNGASEYQDPRDAMMNRSTSAPTTGAAAMMAAAIAAPETGRAGALTDPARFIRTRVTPAQNAGRSSSAYGPLQLTKTYLESFKRRQYGNLSPAEQDYLDRLIAQGGDFLAADRAGAYRDPIHGYGGKGTMGDTAQDRETYLTIAQKSLADLAQQSPNYDSFIRQFRGENDPRYFDTVRRQTGKTPEQLFHELRKTDIRAMGKPATHTTLQPKPRDYTPVPDGAKPPGAPPSAGMTGTLDVNVRLRDGDDRPIGQPATHKINLGNPTPHGLVPIDAFYP